MMQCKETSAASDAMTAESPEVVFIISNRVNNPISSSVDWSFAFSTNTDNYDKLVLSVPCPIRNRRALLLFTN
jgi:hypothetical protein